MLRLIYHEFKVLSSDQFVGSVLSSDQKICDATHTASQGVAVMSTNEKLHLDGQVYAGENN